MAIFLNPASQALLDRAMIQLLAVTYHVGALIALGPLPANNLAWMSKFFSAGGE
jgi:hypothetical protein